MSVHALRTQGMTIAVENATTAGLYDPIGEVTNINGPTGQAPTIDVTDLASTAREKILGLPDNGQMSLSVWFRPEAGSGAEHDRLWSLFKSYEKASFEVTFTDSTPTKWRFDAYVSGFVVNSDIDNAVTADITLEVTGEITENPA